jgi:hypothetical protein
MPTFGLLMRTVIFRPYLKGKGPVFTLRMYEPTRWGRAGGERPRIGYRLFMSGKLLFEGDDYGPSQMHSWDGDESVEALMSFLTLRPGDTDADYFDKYTPGQLAYCSEHAEALSAEVETRFGRNKD